jgi:dephospho-CoA kinase
MNIAITGGMGSGKSTVSHALCKLLKGTLVSADHVCRDLLAVGCKGWVGLKKITPVECFLPGGEVDRPVFRKAIFADDSFRKQVDDLLHPMVRKELQSICSNTGKDSHHLIVEVPLLYEKAWQNDFNCTVLVYTDDEICIDRVMKRDKVTRVDAMEAIASQMPLEQKVALADYVVSNSTTFAETIEQLEHLIEMGAFARKGCLSTEKT